MTQILRGLSAAPAPLPTPSRLEAVALVHLITTDINFAVERRKTHNAAIHDYSIVLHLFLQNCRTITVGREGKQLCS